MIYIYISTLDNFIKHLQRNQNVELFHLDREFSIGYQINLSANINEVLKDKSNMLC